MSAPARCLACVMTAYTATPDPVDADAKALVLYATTHGHNAKIAARTRDRAARGVARGGALLISADDVDPAQIRFRRGRR